MTEHDLARLRFYEQEIAPRLERIGRMYGAPLALGFLFPAAVRAAMEHERQKVAAIKAMAKPRRP